MTLNSKSFNFTLNYHHFIIPLHLFDWELKTEKDKRIPRFEYNIKTLVIESLLGLALFIIYIYKHYL